ncbi:hypothetical protein [uncultured Clostridium sp.]|uniref:hypothetical protein n=1 Tax=uncultured Clostridium sp. TaxID=59620 RepID=UPI002613ECA1|nr:hypothetical protein [uncultured Clostridium sp.]
MKKFIFNLSETLYLLGCLCLGGTLIYQLYFNVKTYGWFNKLVLFDDISLWIFALGLCIIMLALILLFMVVAMSDVIQNKNKETNIPTIKPQLEDANFNNNDSDIIKDLISRRITIVIDEKGKEENSDIEITK